MTLTELSQLAIEVPYRLDWLNTSEVTGSIEVPIEIALIEINHQPISKSLKFFLFVLMLQLFSRSADFLL